MKVLTGMLCLFAVSSRFTRIQHIAHGSTYYGPSSISITPSSPLTVNEGRSYSSSYPRCLAHRCNGCTFRWTGNGVNIGSSTLYSSSVTVARSHDGVYTCTVWNTHISSSTKTKQIRIIVNYGPASVSVSPFSSLTIQEGQLYGSASAMCIASGCNQICETSWRKGSKLVTQDSELYGSSVIAERTQAGTYTCVGEKAVTKTADFKLTMKYPPDVMASWNGLTNTISCKANGVPANYNFRFWKHVMNGVTIRQIVGVRKSADTLLHSFDGLTYEDSGDYICTVDNGLNSTDTGKLIVQEGTQSLLIYAKPLVIEFTETHGVSKGDSVNISFEIYAVKHGSPSLFKHDINGTERPVPTSQYTYSNTWHTHPVPFHGKMVDVAVYRQTLTILTVEEDFFGNFTVRFENQQGVSEVYITLVPRGVPDIPTNLSIVNTTQNSAILVFTTGFANGPNQWVVIEYKSAEVKSSWHNGVSVEAGVPSNVTILTTVSGLASDTNYMFRAYANNSYNTSDYTEEYVNAITKVSTLSAPPVSPFTGADQSYLPVAIGVAGGCGVILTLLAIYILKYKTIGFGICKDITTLRDGKMQARNQHKLEEYDNLRLSRITLQDYDISSSNVNEKFQSNKDGRTFNVYEDVQPPSIPKQPKIANGSGNEDGQFSTRDMDCNELKNVSHISRQKNEDLSAISTLEATHAESHTNEAVPPVPEHVKIEADCSVENDKPPDELEDEPAYENLRF